MTMWQDHTTGNEPSFQQNGDRKMDSPWQKKKKLSDSKCEMEKG